MADQAATQRRRGPGRRFEKGQSGNPSGRRPGIETAQTMLARVLLQDDLEKVVAVIVKAALGGDLPAAFFIVNKLVPDPVRTRGRVEITPIGIHKRGRDALKANLASILEALADDVITAEEAATMTAVVNEQLTILANAGMADPPLSKAEATRLAANPPPQPPLLPYPYR